MKTLENRVSAIEKTDSTLIGLMQQVKTSIITGFEQIDKRFEQVDKRFEQIDKKFEQVDRRFEQIDKRFRRVDKRIDELTANTAFGFQRIENRLDNLTAELSKINEVTSYEDIFKNKPKIVN